MATGKPATIRVYWCSDIALGVRYAMTDGCDVCSISWGSDEANWGQAAANDMDAAATEATTAGMVVFAASGDNDSSDGQASSIYFLTSCQTYFTCAVKLTQAGLN